MQELSFMRNHLTSVTLPFLSLEISAEDGLPLPTLQAMTSLLEKAWPFFLMAAEQEKLYDELPLNLHKKVLEVELIWTNNSTMQSLNQMYRQKDSPTDVLTFTLLADADEPDLWMILPVLHLGSIFISLEYAEAAIKEHPGLSLEQYLLERFIHGMLHLFGMHHDTMEKFEKVSHIQKRVMDIVFAANQA
jgi:probable rRNA maturation factor